ncbi:MAG TPA: DUF4142 domain-containing protein [Casimicrobiaceae bacterium]|nr:DUF4142 domain-containing protein [Casimicrobiaceae bacterium]
MSNDPFGKVLITCAVLALGGAALPLTSRAMSHGQRAPTAGTGKNPAVVASSLSQGERRFIEQAAQGGMAEVEMGQLAEQRAQSPEVRAFGQRMVRDHSEADAKLDQIAGSKGVSIPAGLDEKAQSQYDRLQKLAGARFDREYMATMVSDHEKDIADFAEQERSAKDSDVKNFARTTLQTLEEQLKIAKADRAAVQAENPSASIAKSSASSANERASPPPSTGQGAQG